MAQKEIFNRSELLLGREGMEALERTRVIVFGVGGVGSWCAEGLVRAGLTHLTICLMRGADTISAMFLRVIV